MINLLPPAIKQERHTKSRIYGFITFYIIGIGVMVLGPLALMTYNFTLKSSLDNLASQVQTLEKQKSDQNALISQAAFLEDRLKAAISYQNPTHWDNILDRIAASTPTDTQITDIKMTQTDKTTFSLTGNTTDRRSVVLFADKLNEDKSFVGATVDTITDSTTGTSKTFQFTISFSLASSTK